MGNDFLGNLERLKSVLLNETPILFLGAGFSLGAKTKHGNDVPTGSELKKIIIEKFLKLTQESADYKELSNYSLSQVCQFCNNKQDPQYLTDFLTSFFSQLRPADFHYRLTNYFWKKIYSTNIDDLVETVFKDNEKSLLVQQFKRKNTHRENDATEYFKLHGSVNNPSEGYTFSTDEYVDSIVQSRDYRFSTLASDMHSEHFIFLGSSFEEFNLDYYFKLYENTGYASSRGKVFVVNPRPSLLLRSKLERIQGILIEWTTTQFFDFIDSLINTNATVDKYDLNKDVDKLGFKSLKAIRQKLSSVTNYDSSLYLGYEPRWEDVLFDWDFINREVSSVLEDFLALNYDRKASVLTLYGKPYIGKSTYLRRIAVTLHNYGFETYYFVGKNFNYYPFLQIIRKASSSEFAIIVDNASYYYSPLKQLMKHVPIGKKLVVVTASRPYFHFKWRYNFVGENFTEVWLDPKISRSYARTIESKLDEKGYLGELKTLVEKDARIDKIVKSNDIMSFLFSITYGNGFIQRLNKDLKPVIEGDSQTKDILLALAIFAKLELPHFPAELITYFSNNRAKEFIKKIDAFTKTTFENNLQLRSGFFTKDIIKSVTLEKVIDHVKEILIAISAQVDDISHSYWNEIHASLIKEKILRTHLGLSSQQIRILLYSLRNYYSDNFNYWIQLGIAEQREKDFEKALNHFRQAEALRPNSYMVQNAIGRNFLKQANATGNVAIASKYFEEGAKILIELIENREEHQAKAFSTHTYLHEKIIFLDRFKIISTNEDLNKMGDYLKRITDKDPDDIMARHITNKFVSHLRRIKKANLYKLELHDLSKLKSLFFEPRVDLDEVIDDLEFV